MWGSMGHNNTGFGGGLGRGTGHPQRGVFQEQYHCYSVAYADKAHLEKGDKILLPPSAFDSLARLQVDYPMLFRLESSDKGTMTHSGVLEFTAEEGSCYIPFWMMQNLVLEEGALITVTNVSLPKATFVKLQPQHVDFLEISNPRAVLEHALRNFSCVTKGDVICVPYNSRNYHFMLKEVKPADAACIIETDCNVDFDAPVGYQEGTTTTTSTTGLNAEKSVSSSGNAAPLPPLRKQRADGSSGCPSPTPSSMSAASGGNHAGGQILGGGKTTGMDMDDDKDAARRRPQDNTNNDNNDTDDVTTRIVDGKVIRPNDDDLANASLISKTKLLADQTGSTGVQRNAAIPVQAPQLDYWASLEVGDGARLDGKTPATLQDKDGNIVNVDKVREEQRLKRLAALEARQNAALKNVQGGGMTVAGEKVEPPSPSSEVLPPTKRKSRIGNKFSKLKASGKAFEGSAKRMH